MIYTYVRAAFAWRWDHARSFALLIFRTECDVAVLPRTFWILHCGFRVFSSTAAQCKQDLPSYGTVVILYYSMV